jgi:uncharacterized protein (TIGR02246 family)
MRVLSWVVVTSSVIWLLTYTFMPVLSGFSFPSVNLNQVSGTVASSSAGLPDRNSFAKRYTEAWNSHDPSQVAAFFDNDGTITINDGPTSEGVAQIADTARQFMTAFPDIEVMMVDLEKQGQQLIYHWTFTGTHAETGRLVRINGSETWRLADNGLIAESIGRFDVTEYDRQVNGGL